MTEAISGRDWLAELAAVGDGEVFLRAVGEVAAARPDLADAVCAIAARGWDEVFVQEVRTVFETKAKAKAERVAALEEGRRVRERLAAGAIAELEAKKAAQLAKPREEFFSSSTQPEVVEQSEAEPAGKPEPEPEPKEKVALPAVIPLTPTVGDIWDQALTEMNRVHAVIESVGGKTVIASWEPSPKDENRMELVYQVKEHFLLRYSNKFISYPIPNMRGGVKQESVPVGLWWLNNVSRRQFRGVMFRPGASPEVNNCLNLWQGWGVEDRAGDWGLLRSHILKVICNDNRDFAVYVIRWIAWAIQHPDAPAEVARAIGSRTGWEARAGT